MKYTTRGHALGFASRTRKNLEYIEDAFKSGANVHVITQLANSLLGLIVFPWEKHFVDSISKVRLDDLAKRGWPIWTITKGSCETLGELIKYLRHSVAHGNILFSSDSRNIDEVNIDVENYPSGNKDKGPNWTAKISARDLRQFCILFIELIEDTIG